MGNTPSYQEQYQLQPINPPLMVTEQRFIAQQPIGLKMSQDFSITGDNYTITDLQNNPWFKVSRKWPSLLQTKTLKDLDGTPILILNNRFFSGFDMKSPDGKIVVSARDKIFSSNRLHITVNDKISGQQKLLTLKTCRFDTSGIIFIGEEKLNGIPIGLIAVFRYSNQEK